jgi:hypothetical protein
MYQKTIMDAVAANANLTSSSHEVQYRLMNNANAALEVISTGDGTTATIKLQHSDNGVTFTDAPDGSLALDSANTFTLLFGYVMKKYVRLVYDKGNNAAGAITATLTFS